ncbi:MAG: Spy/CpxP family protein refolding chaperone [Acidobacteriia bacterium]|nr:Spy/CpxP family protein refolding chaperone [Terriglobia bacterium]
MHVCRLGLLAILGAAAAAAQTVPKALESSTPGLSPFAINYNFNYSFGVRSGKWWTSPEMAQKLNLTEDQKRRMDDIFQQHRLKLIDLQAALEKEEISLEPLVGADPPDDAKVFAQIDRVALARAELEKANSRMLWQVRRVLTPDQWKQLQTSQPQLLKPLKVK